MIAAGGTAGHVVPAIAVADALRAEGAEVVFVGGQRAEAELVPAAGYSLESIRVEGISRTNPLKAARAISRAVGGLAVALRLLRRHRPGVVLGGGGYVAGPVGAAAVLLRIPIVLTEADSHLGLTNRALARAARRVCLAFPIEGRTGARYLITGRPVPPRETDRDAARARFGIAPGEDCELVFGGSLGARSRPSPGLASASCTLPAGATSASCAPPARTTSCATTSRPSPTRWRRPTSSSPARAGRSSRSPSTGCRRC
jgi:UDP-N-acetylglucosamine--N-acetylmuramyl-(pentapeptide) pyrophosphoryl-undecaprenol N-acetylglucosamine transferase